MARWKRIVLAGLFVVSAMLIGRPAQAAAEIKLDKDFSTALSTSCRRRPSIRPTNIEARCTRIGSSRSTLAPAGF